MKKLIETRGLCYHYPDGTQALSSINIEVGRGEKVALIGPNGSGKTTLLLHLIGLIKPSSGEVLIHGKPITYDRQRLNDLRKRVGMLFQNHDDQLFAPTVEKDVAFGPGNLGLPADEVESRVENALELVRIDHLRAKPPHLLSSGERKKAAIAGLIAMTPELLLLDEPLGSLDHRGADELVDLLEMLNSEDDVSIVYTGHGLDGMARWADMVYVLNQGSVVSAGRADALAEDADLLRTCNLISRRGLIA